MRVLFSGRFVLVRARVDVIVVIVADGVSTAHRSRRRRHSGAVAAMWFTEIRLTLGDDGKGARQVDRRHT